MITKSINKLYTGLCAFSILCALCVSCEDFFDQESEHVIFTNTEHLNNATDTVYSVTGILNKLQALADRTILLGEARGELVDLTNDASSDLRDVALFNIGDDNQYNVPRDYYAVINNCNYFIAHADTALRNNRNDYIFMREYAAVKAIRAWTYLQLVLNYGSVPFVTEPILTKAEAEANYPRYDLQKVCEYFINDLLPLAERWGNEYPQYGTIRNTDSRLFYFPINIVLGDMNLWTASLTGNVSLYREAALRYYKYINERNGLNSAYPIGLTLVTWTPGSTTWTGYTSWSSGSLTSESYATNSEIITMIPGDSIRAEGNYSELRNIFNSREENDYKVSLVPSKFMFNLSESQMHCCVSKSGTSVYYAPSDLPNHRSGDLRLWYYYTDGETTHPNTGERIQYQSIDKYATRNVHIYRRQMVYLRLAEALNRGGFPRAAYQILSQGLNNEVLEDEVYPYCSESDSAWISQIDMPATRYGIFTVEALAQNRSTERQNTIGVHTRGSGFTPLNDYYYLRVDTTQTEEAQLPAMQEYVDSLLLNEEALEFVFEGTRFYDLMRFAYRQSNPGKFMAEHVYARKGADKTDIVRSDVKSDLTDTRNWFLKWNGKIGLQ